MASLHDHISLLAGFTIAVGFAWRPPDGQRTCHAGNSAGADPEAQDIPMASIPKPKIFR